MRYSIKKVLCEPIKACIRLTMYCISSGQAINPLSKYLRAPLSYLNLLYSILYNNTPKDKYKGIQMIHKV